VRTDQLPAAFQPPPLPDFDGAVEHAFEKAGRLSVANAKVA